MFPVRYKSLFKSKVVPEKNPKTSKHLKPDLVFSDDLHF